MLYPVGVTVGLKTLGFRGNPVEFLAEHSASSVTFVKEQNSPDCNFLLRKNLAPRARFDLGTLR